MKKLTIFNMSLGLLGLLLASFAVFVLDRSAQRSWPSITNNRPSGFMAFAELLRRDGYQVVLERSGSPRLQPGDLAVAPNFVETRTAFEQWMTEADEERNGERSNQTLGAKDTSLTTAFKKHVKAGGQILYIPMPYFFDDASKLVIKDQPVMAGASSEGVMVSLGSINRLEQDRPDWSRGDTESEIWAINGSQLVTGVATYGKGKIGLVADGLMVTNRHLDEDSNAEVLVDTVRRLAKPGSRVVFVESTFGNMEAPGLFAAIGPWASAARWQMILLLVVVIFTLGRRFGLPDVEHPVERGARDMLVAISTTLRLNRRANLALSTIASEAVERARRILRMPPSSIENDVLARIPAGLAAAIREARVRDINPKPLNAREHAQWILRELKAFEQDSRDPGRRS